MEEELKKLGFYYRPKVDLGEQLLFASGSYYDSTGDLQTHFIHIVKTGSMDWRNYINFRDYLNSTPDVAKVYEDLKTISFVMLSFTLFCNRSLNEVENLLKITSLL